MNHLNQTRKLALWVCCLVLLGQLCGCGSPKTSTAVENARRMLQINRSQKAIDALGKDDSAEAHYLKAVALQRLKLEQAAKAQIEEALKQNPDEPKYQAFKLLLGALKGKKDESQKLCDLQRQHSGNGAVAFLSIPAYVISKDIPGSLESFKTSFSLIDDCPEYMYYMLHQVLTSQLKDSAPRLIEKLQAAAPEDPELLMELCRVAIGAKFDESARKLFAEIERLQPENTALPGLKVEMELMLGHTQGAVAAAEKIVNEDRGNPQALLIYGEALARSKPSAEVQAKLKQLADDNPEIPELMSKYALYLTQQKQLAAAVAAINMALTRARSEQAKRDLMSLAIGLPMQAEDADLTEKQLAIFSPAIKDPVLRDYFDARLLYLKRDYDGALAKFQAVLAANSNEKVANKTLAAESLVWMQKILQKRLAQHSLKGATKAVEKVAPKKPDPTPEPAKP